MAYAKAQSMVMADTDTGTDTGTGTGMDITTMISLSEVSGSSAFLSELSIAIAYDCKINITQI